MMINRPEKSYWAWRKRFAFFPVRMLDTKELIWLEPYYWRYVFNIMNTTRKYTTSKTPFPEYDDHRVKIEGAAQLLSEIKRCGL